MKYLLKWLNVGFEEDKQLKDIIYKNTSIKTYIIVNNTNNSIYKKVILKFEDEVLEFQMKYLNVEISLKVPKKNCFRRFK